MRKRGWGRHWRSVLSRSAISLTHFYCHLIIWIIHQISLLLVQFHCNFSLHHVRFFHCIIDRRAMLDELYVFLCMCSVHCCCLSWMTTCFISLKSHLLTCTQRKTLQNSTWFNQSSEWVSYSHKYMRYSIPFSFHFSLSLSMCVWKNIFASWKSLITFGLWKILYRIGYSYRKYGRKRERQHEPNL